MSKQPIKRNRRVDPARKPQPSYPKNTRVGWTAGEIAAMGFNPARGSKASIGYQLNLFAWEYMPLGVVTVGLLVTIHHGSRWRNVRRAVGLWLLAKAGVELIELDGGAP